MHGRVKIKSTAQNEEKEKQRRERKLNLYVAAKDACFSLRKDGIRDNEALQLTEQLLLSNPEFTTIWNYRREILMHLEASKEEDHVQRMYEAELSFVESCLKASPKSYSSWHHRGWVAARLPRPDWARELSLCNDFLKLDERNFHCWDYRRMAVEASGAPVDQELQFSDRLIHSNISNYSSWHYRSTLLPLLQPAESSPPELRPTGDSPPPTPPSSQETHSHRVGEEQLLKEYDLVRNACFTDPDDQSAWFYYRWLLGRAEHGEMISCLYVSRKQESVCVALSRPVDLQSVGLMLVLDGEPHRVEWRSVHPRFKHSPVWICELPPGTISDVRTEYNLTVHWTDEHTHRDCTLYAGRTESWCRESATERELFRGELSVEKTSVLQTELQSCKQLQELEPQNKWCVLTTILLLRALDPLGYEKETLAHLRTLKEVDPMRSAYYDDLCSKFMIENTILKMEYAEVRVFSLPDKNLTTLCHLDQLLLVTHVKLSSNRLERLPPQLSMLRCLEVLEADNNAIEELEGLYQLPGLEEVLLQNNNISKLSALRPLASCPKLTRLNLRGNPVTRTDNIQSELAKLLPSVTDLML